MLFASILVLLFMKSNTNQDRNQRGRVELIEWL